MQVKAQYIDESAFTGYDTVMVYTPSQIVGYPASFDTIRYTWRDSVYWPLDYDNPCNCPDDYVAWTNYVDYSVQFSSFHVVRLKYRWMGIDTTDFPNGFGCIPGASKIANGLAQSYHLEDSAIVAGIALYCDGWFGNDDPLESHHIYLFDTNFNEIANGPFYTRSFTMLSTGFSFTYNNHGLNKYYFKLKAGESYPKVKDFYLGFDVAGIMRVNHTCKLDDDILRDSLPAYGYCYDTIFLGRIPNDLGGCYGELLDTVDFPITDTIPLCSYEGDPYFRDTNGVWNSFATDERYWAHRKVFMYAFPIILVPHATSSEIDINVEDYCQVYPNPTRTILKVLSNFNIWSIQLVDMNGREVYRQDNLNNFMDEINVESFPRGTYIVNIVTSKGRCSKKIILN